MNDLSDWLCNDCEFQDKCSRFEAYGVCYPFRPADNDIRRKDQCGEFTRQLNKLKKRFKTSVRITAGQLSRIEEVLRELIMKCIREFALLDDDEMTKILEKLE